jgi:hypothetical protein
MAVIKPVTRRIAKLIFHVTEPTKQRLDELRREVVDRGMEFPLDELIERAVIKILDQAERELAGAPPAARARRRRTSTANGPIGDQPAAEPPAGSTPTVSH